MLLLGHPRDQLVLQFAATELDAHTHSRVAGHLAACPRCAAVVRLARDVASAARAVPSPRARPATFEASMRARAAGTRIILPLSALARPRHRRARFVAVAAAAVVMLGGVTLLARRTGELSGRVQGAWGFFLIESANAQTSDVSASSEPAITFAGLRLHPVRLAYGFRGGDGTALSGGDTLDLVATRAQDVDAWTLTHTWTMPSQRGSEITVVDRASLRPVSRAVTIAPGLSGSQEWTGDSLRSTLHAAGGTRAVAAAWRQREPMLASDAFGFVALGAVPLGVRWSGALAVAGYGWSSEAVFFRATLRVVGSERIRVPAGEFDCWRLVISVDGVTQHAWVRKADGIAVRAWRPQQQNLHAVDRVLLSERSNAP